MSIRILYAPLTFWLLLLLHVLAAVAIACTDLPLWLLLWLLLLVLFSARQAIQDYGPGSDKRIQACHISSTGVVLETGSASLSFNLLRIIFLSEFLVVLDFGRPREPGPTHGKRGHKLILLPGALQQADYCRLQRYLRFENQGLRIVSRGGSIISG